MGGSFSVICFRHSLMALLVFGLVETDWSVTIVNPMVLPNSH